MANIIVLFEVNPTKAGMKKYLDLAAMLKPMLSGFEGFIRAERFSSLNEDGKLLSNECVDGRNSCRTLAKCHATSHEPKRGTGKAI